MNPQGAVDDFRDANVNEPRGGLSPIRVLVVWAERWSPDRHEPYDSWRILL